VNDKEEDGLNTRAARAVGFAAILASALILLTHASPVAATEEVTLSESGSTLLYPLFNVWVTEYTKTHPGVHITTSSTGSGVGIDQAVSGAIQIGTSDAYMSDSQARQNPQILNIAMAISALTVNYNVPGLAVKNLKLDGPTLTGIYSGTIRSWDDRAIAALNPGVRLPRHEIIPVRRSDGSGDTFVFTQYLTFSTTWWEDHVGFGTSIAWPAVAGSLSAPGNAGVLRTVKDTAYSLTYLGVSFHAEIEQANLGTAMLKSYSGEFLLPTTQSIAAAAAALSPRTPTDERLTLVNAPGSNAYPLVNYEYAMVSRRQANPAVAAAIRRFLQWAVAPDETNERLLEDAHFIALPAHIWVLSHDQIESIQ
jgi:phosphate transport system substrate-binding protein